MCKKAGNILLLLFFLFLSVGASAQNSRQNNSKPNVIFIMADDLGRGLLSYYGQKIIATPAIDRLANEGVVFENAYAGAFCAPSRAAFLTGYSDCRKNKWKLTSAGIYESVAKQQLSDEEAQRKINDAIGVEPDVMYLAQVFKKAGYTTAQIGKLDWGFATTTRQLQNHGWDYFYGYYDHQQCHGFYQSFLHENGKLINIPGNTFASAAKNGEWGSSKEQQEFFWNRNGKAVYSQDLFMQKLKSFLHAHQSKPFFLYFATQLPHGPVAIPSIHPDYVFNDSLTDIEKQYASMVKRLDDDVAAIMQELKDLGMADNTIVVFSSDKGHEIYYSYKDRIEKPYKNMHTGKLFDNIRNVWSSESGGDVFDGTDGMSGLKRSNFEGGLRVPLFVHWPQKIKKNKVFTQPVANYDFLATIADLLKVQIAEKKDGVSYLPAITGNKKFTGHDYVAYASHAGPTIIDKDGWKLRYYAPEKIFELYYLPNDKKEKNNLLNKYPAKAKTLQAQLTAICDGDIHNGWFRDGLEIINVK